MSIEQTVVDGINIASLPEGAIVTVQTSVYRYVLTVRGIGFVIARGGARFAEPCHCAYKGARMGGAFKPNCLCVGMLMVFDTPTLFTSEIVEYYTVRLPDAFI